MSDPILVTGGAGYIGSHACKALANAGFLPIVYDNLSTGHAYAAKWGPFVEGDLLDTTKLQETILAFKPKAVMHFAAKALVSESMENPALYYENNFVGTLSLLNAMRDCGVSSLVFSSTCATYGHAQFTPMTEDHPQAPISPYGRTKWMAEQLMSDFDAAYGLKTIVLRYFNAAGADLDAEIGENHLPETHLIPSMIQAALGLKNEAVIYGTDFPTADGSAIRDYIHVQDLAEAHVLALRHLLSTQKSDVFNLGTGHGISVLEILRAVQALYTGSDSSIGGWQGGAPNLSQAKPAPKQLNLNKLSDAGGLKDGCGDTRRSGGPSQCEAGERKRTGPKGCPTSPAPILESRAVYINPFPVRFHARRPGDPSILMADSRKAQEILRWSPRYSDLSILVESAWKWHRLLVDATAVLQQ